MPTAAAKAESGSDGRGKSKNRSQSTSEFTTKMDGMLELLNQRMEGRVSTSQVESAVDDLLITMGAPRGALAKNSHRSKTTNTATTTAAAVLRNNKTKPQSSSGICEDLGNYDDSSDEENEEEEKVGDVSHSLKEPKRKKRRLDESKIKNDNSNNLHGADQSCHGQKTSNISIPSSSIFANDDAYRDAISQIPMGKEAAKMMTTFGDGPNPLPDPIELALMGTRKALQVSIMDARKVRRRLQKEYRDAQSVVMRYNPNNKYKNSDKYNPTVAAAAAWVAEQQQQQESASTPNKTNGASLETITSPSESKGKSNQENEVESDENETEGASSPSGSQKPSTAATTRPSVNSIDPRLVYRALAEGTDKLSYAHKCGFHMEELTHLYPEEMRAYQRWNEMHEEYNESKGDDGVATDGNDNQEEGAGATKDDDDVQNEPDGGHLRERAANFDYRTDQMKNDWYVEYAKVRQGSFLPNSGRVKRTKAEIGWDRLRKLKKGRHAAGEWENINARAVRFLHWLGFDPPNLYPPDEETTQALAFLAYDRFGRIVEKAIFLRNEKEDQAQSLWELPPGEQLSTQDIERALQDPDIKPATVYGTEDTKDSSSIQLYFGPGWEDRLELEMEE